jgi:hypothetical protein
LGSLVYVVLCRSFRLPVFMDTWRIFQVKIASLVWLGHEPN